MADAPNSQAPCGYHGRYLRVDLTRGVGEGVPLTADELRHFLGGSGLGVQLLLREHAARAGPLSAEASHRVRVQPAGRQSVDDLGQVRRGEQEPADGADQRFLGQQRIRHRRQKDGVRRRVDHGPCAAAVGLGDRRRRCASGAGGVAVGPGHRRGGGPAARTLSRRRQRRRDRPGRRAASPLRDDLPRRPARGPRRQRRGPGGEERQSGRRARHATLPLGAPSGTGGPGQTVVGPLVRPGDGQVPRTRHRRQLARVQSPARPADAQLSAGQLRGCGGFVPRVVIRRAGEDAGLLCGLHDRLRTHLPAGSGDKPTADAGRADRV